MNDPDAKVPETPATWENVVVGEVEELAGRVLHNDELTEYGKQQKETAHQVRAEYEEEHRE